MTRSTSVATGNTPARLDELRALLDTAAPSQARAAVQELLALYAQGDGGDDALRLAVRFCGAADYSDDDLLRLWAALDGDPDGFCADLLAPAYCARKAVKKLVTLSAPGDGGHALRLAARFTHRDEYAVKLLLRLWRTARDPDGFAEHLLAPAFRRDGLSELRLADVTSLTGLRHLTMLDRLDIDGCRKTPDFTEIGELTGLGELSLLRCPIEDLTPIGRLTRLTRLDLRQCEDFEDIEPLLNLGSLRELDLRWTRTRSTDGFGRAFPALESLNLSFCRFLTDVSGLCGLRGLTRLELGPIDSRELPVPQDLPALAHLRLSGHDPLGDLSPFDAFPSLESLEIDDCEGLTTVAGLGTGPRLRRLCVDGCHNLRTLEGLGEQPALRDVRLNGGRRLADLSGLGGLPALRSLLINGTAIRDLDGLAGSPLTTLSLLYMKELDSLDALQECHGLKELTLRDCPLAEEIPADSLTSLSLSGAGWKDLSSLARLPHLAELDLNGCRSLKDLRPLLAMGSLTRVKPPRGFWDSEAPGTREPVLAELEARGTTIVRSHA
ncbi:leucine-rich repeat domain-containing protein [Streptomyces sp. NRRL F-5126]|uniref:leucine-rich repeat domain-containing protein n=1 Tax=Streptomyces sp. NRRL F-5126 TaxID=1463857 RepID=UPI000B21E820|nr:leucine-rich repeat domain-containing protein [Streptomyces sp. NRRL F-5126]